MNRNMICDNLSVSADGSTLLFAGHSTRKLMNKYGSALYVMDEERIRKNAQTYVQAMRDFFGPESYPLYASKAAAFKQMYRIINEEQMGIDVVSCGELFTAKEAGFPMEKTYFHGNHKTDEDLRFAIQCGVGTFVVDSIEELNTIDAIAAECGIRQNILLRLTPGIDPHTYEAVATGKVDSKFGASIETGAAEEITLMALTLDHVSLCGFHCHVGSQVFDSQVFFDSAAIMMRFIAAMRDKTGFLPKELNLGGGYGVRYTADDPIIDIRDNIAQVAAELKRLADEYQLCLPHIRMEPGRSIVADAGITLYTVGVVKRIPGYKNYVCVDGGMTDNPRFALYQSQYTVLAAEKLNQPCDLRCDLVGRCCESGDVIQENILLPESIVRGDMIAVLTTGAYNYSMASNYNRYPRLPVIMVNGKDTYVAVRRESFEDIVRNDL